MPRAFPSQIAAYCAKVFPNGNYSAGLFEGGPAAGFLELYDQLPHELIRLPSEEYADLVNAVATMRIGLDLFRSSNDKDLLRSVIRGLHTARMLIEKLPDEVPSVAHDLAFITDPQLREMIGLDIEAISNGLQSGEWKGTTIIAGSCCEALLLYGLQTKESKHPGTIQSAVLRISWSRRPPNAADLTHRSWDLFSYALVGHEIKLISDNTKSALEPARDYRNLIHPAKSVREQTACNRGTAYVGVGAVEHVIVDLRKNL
ncbi:MAG: hypothetical protein JO047_17825 [Alphaproteobacteria bacterium]|nr:hypothetical protein [Alphaproteobacteria bacterium]